MTDIVDILRSTGYICANGEFMRSKICGAAADEIERLREELGETNEALASCQSEAGGSINRLKNLLDEETRDSDAVLRYFGLNPDRFRTEFGYLNLPKIRAAIQHPEWYPPRTPE